MRDMLEQKLARFEDLERQMADPVILADSGKMGAAAREYGSLAKLAGKYKKFKGLVTEIGQINEMLTSPDAEEREMAAVELPELKAKREKLWEELLDMSIGGEDANRSRC